MSGVEAEAPEVLTVGRIGVDLYPEQTGVPLSEVTTFARSLGGTATNVAVGATRLGRRVAVLTKVGPDPFGTFVREALAGFGVDASHVGTAEELLTPIVFCALDPPEDPPLLFYRLTARAGPDADQGRRPVGPGARRPAALGDRHRRLHGAGTPDPARHAGPPGAT